MMSNEERSLAERAVACPAWSWHPGMCAELDGHQFIVVVTDTPLLDRALPVLSHPATRGWLCELVKWGGFSIRRAVAWLETIK